MLTSIKTKLKHIYFRLKHRKELVIGENVKIAAGSVFEGMNKIYPRSSFSGFMGYGSYIGWDCDLSARARIGRFTCVAPFTQMNEGRHPYTEPFVTAHPAFYSLRKQNGMTFAKRQMFEEVVYTDEESKYSVEIGSDCWIGQGAMIVGGVRIGDGGIVLARAVVTKDVPPYAIVGGVPAKIISYRYDKDTVDLLLRYKWWDKDIEWFQKNWMLLTNIEMLKNQIKSDI